MLVIIIIIIIIILIGALGMTDFLSVVRGKLRVPMKAHYTKYDMNTT